MPEIKIGEIKDAAGPQKQPFQGAFQLLLIFVSFISLSYVVYNSWQNISRGAKDFEDSAVSASLDKMKLPEAETKPLTYYEEKVASRDLFNSGKQTVPGTDLSVTLSSDQQAVSPAATGLGNLQLKGIILDQEPQAIIQDADTKKSFFVRKGELLQGAVVKSIETEKVVLEYQGESIELLREQ